KTLCSLLLWQNKFHTPQTPQLSIEKGPRPPVSEGSPRGRRTRCIGIGSGRFSCTQPSRKSPIVSVKVAKKASAVSCPSHGYTISEAVHGGFIQKVIPAEICSEYPSTVEVAWNSLKYLNPSATLRSGKIRLPPAPSPRTP